MSDTCVPTLIVIGTAINQLETKVSLKTICCLRLLLVVYKHVMFVLSLIVINSTINQLESKVSLINTHCLRLFVVVYKVEML